MAHRSRGRRLRCCLKVTAAILAGAVGQPAFADNRQAPPHYADAPGIEYLWDGGSLPFVFGSTILAGSLRLWVEPPETPRLFDQEEGGEVVKGDTVPEVYVVGYALAGTALVGALPSDSRWFHLKGYAEATLTTLALTESAKVIFGRHRPTYTNGSDVDQRRSFFSGHGSTTLAVSTYLALYLNGHVFAGLRDDDAAFVWWEVFPLGALAAVSFLVPYSRVVDNRHHVGDVLTGSAVGLVTGSAFYIYQEARFRKAKRRYLDATADIGRRVRVDIAPLTVVDGGGLALVGRF